MVGEWHAAALQIFFPHNGVISVAATRPLQQKVSVVCIPAIFLFLLCWTLINSYPSFQDASNSDEGQLRKTELKLYEVVVDIMFRPLFHGIVQPKALLSFGPSPLFFPPIGEL